VGERRRIVKDTLSQFLITKFISRKGGSPVFFSFSKTYIVPIEKSFTVMIMCSPFSFHPFFHPMIIVVKE